MSRYDVRPRAEELSAVSPPAPLEAKALAKAGIAGWAARLGPPGIEAPRSRRLAHVGALAAIAALVLYLVWRVLFTLPSGEWNLTIAWILLTFEALPLTGLVLKAWAVWNIDSRPPAPVDEAPHGMRVAVLIPTYNEPIEVLTPTVAAACELAPAHETWVLDDGDRPWVEEMCAAYGARYVRRDVHDHAKAGNMNHALDLMAAEEAAGAPGIDIIAVLDCDHVPLPTFLTATLGWFADDEVALIQGPQSFYNGGAFDDDGITGEQGMFFNVMMPSRNVPGAGPFWCGSTSLLRVSALREVGGVATETITEDMHTTLKLIRRGWKTVYHHQTLAVGLAPATPDQYLLQRRRWGMGAMQILVHEKLWAAKSWMSWRNYHEYLNGTLWWLEGIATLVAFLIPVLVMLSGAQTSTAGPAPVHRGLHRHVHRPAVGFQTADAPRDPLAHRLRAAHLPRPGGPGVPVVADHPEHPPLRGHAQGRRGRPAPRPDTAHPDRDGRADQPRDPLRCRRACRAGALAHVAGFHGRVRCLAGSRRRCAGPWHPANPRRGIRHIAPQRLPL